LIIAGHKADDLLQEIDLIVMASMTLTYVVKFSGVNHMGPFLLSQLMREKLAAAGRSRVVYLLNLGRIPNPHLSLGIFFLQFAPKWRIFNNL